MRHGCLMLVALCTLAGCQRQADPPPTSTATTAPPPTASVPKSVPIRAQPEKPADALASHQADFGENVVADVTEFRRKGNTLTAVIRLRNLGANTVALQVRFRDSYVLDEGQGKKYEVLKDENDTPLAAPATMEGLVSGASLMVWMKFPAPPRELRSVTFVMHSVVPFEDLPIQDQ